MNNLSYYQTFSIRKTPNLYNPVRNDLAEKTLCCFLSDLLVSFQLSLDKIELTLAFLLITFITSCVPKLT